MTRTAFHKCQVHALARPAAILVSLSSLIVVVRHKTLQLSRHVVQATRLAGRPAAAAATAASVLLALTQRATLGEGCRHLSTQGYTGVVEIRLQPLIPRVAASSTQGRRHLLQLLLEDDTLAQHRLVHRLLHAPLRNTHAHRGLAPEGSVQPASWAAPWMGLQGSLRAAHAAVGLLWSPESRHTRARGRARGRLGPRAPRAAGGRALPLPRRAVFDHAAARGQLKRLVARSHGSQREARPRMHLQMRRPQVECEAARASVHLGGEVGGGTATSAGTAASRPHRSLPLGPEWLSGSSRVHSAARRLKSQP